MSLVESGLLKEYLAATNVNHRLTGGRRFNWNKTEGTLSFSNKSGITVLIIGIVIGMSTLSEGIKLARCSSSLFGRRKWEGSYSCKEFGVTGMFVIALSLTVYPFTTLSIIHCKTWQQLLVNMIQMEKMYCGSDVKTGKHAPKCKSANLLCKLIRIVGVAVCPVFFGMVGAVLPFLPMTTLPHPPVSIVYSLVEKHANWYVQKVAAFTVTWLNWGINVKFGLVPSIEMVLGAACLTDFMINFEHRMTAVGNVPFLQFNLQFYRQIQIITEMFNETNRHCLVALFLGYGLVEVGTAVEFIQPNKEILTSAEAVIISMAVKMLNIIVFLNGSIILTLLFGCCSQLHEASSRSLVELRSRASPLAKKDHTYWKRSIWSVPVLRIRFGSTNYIEKLTPIVFQMYLLDRIVDLLLVKKRR